MVTTPSWVVWLRHWREGKPSRRTWTDWTSGPVWNSWSSTRPSAKSCTCTGVTTSINTGWGMKGLRAALLRRAWGYWWMKTWTWVWAAGWGRGFCPSAPLCWDPFGSPVSSSGALSKGQTWTCWSGAGGGPQKWSEGWNTSPRRKGWES